MCRTIRLFNILFISALLAVLVGCTSDGSSVIIWYNQAPLVTGDTSCMTEPNFMHPGLSRGRIDTNADSGYLFTPLVQNIASTDGDPLGQGQRRAEIQGANMRLEFADGLFSADDLTSLQERNLVNFSQPFSFSVGPDGGLASLKFTIVPRALLAEMQAKLGAGERTNMNAEIQLFGVLAGGSFESPKFVYPLEVCDGCLIDALGLCAGACQTLQDPICPASSGT
ncbi:MAG: hypothetical protein MJE77_24685 [Proteobacteria bacterium]|nr:hypothetical protein [Pseudomonadota bacterium]